MKKALWIFLSSLVCLILASDGNNIRSFGTGKAESRLSPGRLTGNARPDFAKMPLYFVPNEGQMDKRVAFYVEGKNVTVYFNPEGVTFALSSLDSSGTSDIAIMSSSTEQDKDQSPAFQRLDFFGPKPLSRSSLNTSPIERKALPSRWILKLDFVGANPEIRPIPQEKSNALVSYFKGRPGQWRTGLSMYQRIVYPNLWTGIDLAFFGTTDRLKYEFLIHPGADPSKIELAYRGAVNLDIDDEGRLVVNTPLGDLKDDKPVAFQEIENQHADVPVAYNLIKTTEKVAVDNLRNYSQKTKSYNFGFQIGEYDKKRPLILDPVFLAYCGYIGGSQDDNGGGIALDSWGNVYIVGTTNSTEFTFPVNIGPDLTYNGGYNGGGDAFVAKIKPDGTGLIYCGYIGGRDGDSGMDIATDASGNVYITGVTLSDQSSFPVTVGPDLTYNGGKNGDAYVAKIKADGTGLVYCGYIGGFGYDCGSQIAVDGMGNAYVAGETNSDESSFPVKGGPDLTYNGGLYDAFVAKVSADGMRLVYCGYIGGSQDDTCGGVAVDSIGNTYITGLTNSKQDTFPVRIGPDLTFNGDCDAYVARIRADGAGLVYCGYIGGEFHEGGSGIALDGRGNVYITGNTNSPEYVGFPVSVGPDLTYNGGGDAFIAKVKADGTGLVYCGYIGGSTADNSTSIAVDSWENVYLVGFTNSSEKSFPVKNGPDLTFNGYLLDAFVAKVKSDGTDLIYCGYIGGSGTDYGWGIATDALGNAYVVGLAGSPESSFPVKIGPELTYNGGGDAFVAKITQMLIPPRNFSVQKLANRSLSMVEYLVKMTWQANNTDYDDDIVAYRIYQIEGMSSTLIVELSASISKYLIRNVEKTKEYKYGISSVNSEGLESGLACVVVR